MKFNDSGSNLYGLSTQAVNINMGWIIWMLNEIFFLSSYQRCSLSYFSGISGLNLN